MNQETAIRQYKVFKVKYYKVLELAQLIKKQIVVLQPKIPRICDDILNNIKRYIKIIENNEKNSTGNPAPQTQTSQIQKSKHRLNQSKSQKYETSRREENDLLRQIKKIDHSIEYAESDPRVASKWRAEKQLTNRVVDMSLQ